LWTVQEYAEQHTGGGTSLWATWWGHVASAGYVFPTSLTTPVTAKFATDVGPIDSSNFVITLDGTTTEVDGSIVCKNAAGATVACTSGVRSASFTPTGGEWLAGQKYRATVNPNGVVTPVQAGGVDVATASRAWRASTSEQETSAGATYVWRTLSDPSAFGGSYVSERLGAAKARYAFNGTSITWYTVRGPDQGIAQVYIDGVLSGTIDNYWAAYDWHIGRTFGGLTSGDHTIEVVVTGTKRAAAKNSFVVVDAFGSDQTPAVTMTWHPVSASQASGGSYVASDLSSAKAVFDFRGTGVTLYTLRGPNQGKARIFIDGVLRETIDNYNASTQYNYARTWSVADGVHRIEVIVLGQRNASSTGTFICVDRWVVT
jgi:hypothetical protein